MDAIVDFFRSIWGLWLMAIFIGIVVWVMWPGNRKKLERHGDIPLEDEPSEPPQRRTNGAGKGK